MSEIFRTARMICRHWQADDVAAIFAVYSDEEGARWVDDGTPITWDDSVRWLQVTERNYEQRGYGMFALDDLHTGETIGHMGLVHPGGQSEVEIKYAFLRDRWGSGYASEAAPALLAWGAAVHGIDYVIATVAAPHKASQRVLEKSGLRYSHDLPEDDGTVTQVYVWREDGAT